MNESVIGRITSISNRANGYQHWKGFIRFENISQNLFCLVLIGDGNNPDRLGKGVFTKEELPEVYTRYIEKGYSFTHCSVKGGNIVRNWRTGEILCVTNSFLESILAANRYSIAYERMRKVPVDIESEFAN